MSDTPVLSMTQAQVVNKILATKNIDIIKDNSFDRDYFPAYKDEMVFIIDHVKNYGCVPDTTTFLSKFPDFELFEVAESDKYLAEVLSEEYTYGRVANIVQHSASLIQQNAFDGVNYLNAELSKLNVTGGIEGTDIIAKIINKYRTITLGRALLFTDVMIICSSGFLPDAGIDKVVYGLVAMTVTSITLDMYINGIRQSVQFFIFSKKYAEIADTITQNAHRGVTVINGQGWYSKEDVKVITVVARKNESTQIFRLIKEIDPNAFISQSAAIGVYGKGFEN
jgi:hypothetical protein